MTVASDNEAEAKRRGATIVMLHSRQHARPFYARSGYTDQGGRPVFHGNVHFTMTKRLAL
ncbi:GNAT family N-acetyltransferase [bacterium]|nr:MAG: GNAT family N-acetyltransferase [bacterium]